MHIREAGERDRAGIEQLLLESFEPVTWARPLDDRFGPLNGLDWRERWHIRLDKIFAEQIILVGEADGDLAAVSTSTVEPKSALAYIDILGVARAQQGHGYGREMLRSTLSYLKSLGAQYVNLDCLTTNETANALYKSEGFEEVACHIRWFRKI